MARDRIDLSSLDPAQNHKEWEARVRVVAERAWAARRKQISVPVQLMLWARPALALAAGFALLSWISLGAATRFSATTAAPDEDNLPNEPTLALATWERSNQLPETSRIVELLEGSHGLE